MTDRIFRTIAFNETRYWNDLPEGVTAVYATYLIKEGEGTFICSLSPLSRADFIENVFVGVENDHPFVEEHQFTNDEPSVYFAYVNADNFGGIISEPFTIDFDVDDQSNGWDDAREHVNANPPYLNIPG